MNHIPGLTPPDPDTTDIASIETVIVPRSRDIGEFEVKRALPAAGRRMVGPFVFFDQMGPIELINEGMDVRPHPHIGLGTVTYLYDGRFRHRDSTGADQVITSGDVNWMLAGNGVTHSERSDPSERIGRNPLFGIQTWVALPEAHEDDTASFEHHGAGALPRLTAEGKDLRLILGSAYGERAPVTTHSEMFYIDARLDPFAAIPLPDEHEDRALYVMDGAVSVAGDVFEAGRMAVFRPGDPITVAAGPMGARLMLLGGETLNGPRYISWNFVSSSREKLDAAKQAWIDGDFEHGRFRLPVGDTEEFVPWPAPKRP